MRHDTCLRRITLLRSLRNAVGGDDLRGLIAFGAAISCINASRPTASYRTMELGGTAATVGLIAASYAVISLFAAMPLGRQIDRRGPKGFFVGGVSLMVIGAAISAAATNLLMLGAGQAVLGLAQLSAAISFQTITANRRNSDRDRGFARLAVAASTGQLVGPLVGGAILDLDHLPVPVPRTVVVFIVAGLIATAALVAAVRVRGGGPPAADPEGELPVASSFSSIIRRRGVMPALMVGITVLTTIDLLIAYLPVVGESRGIAPGMIGILLAIRASAGLVSRLTMTAMLARWGRKLALGSAMLIAGISLIGVATSASSLVLAITIGLVGFCLGLGSPMTMAWVSMQTPRPDRGTVLAIRMTGNRLSQVAMPTAAGALAAVLGPGAIYAVLAALLMSGSLWVHQSPLE